MDAAIYDSTDSLIIAVRGGRIFKCDPTSGAVLSQADFGQPGFMGTLCWDSVSNRVFAAVMNNPLYSFNTPANPGGYAGLCNIWRIIPSTLATDLVIDFQNNFVSAGHGGFGITGVENDLGVGMLRLHAGSGNIYANAIQVGISGRFVRFLASNIATFINHSNAIATPRGFNSSCLATVGGHDTMYYVLNDFSVRLVAMDFVANTLTSLFADASATFGFLAVEYAPSVGQIFITDQFQFIYVFSTAGALLSTINTGRSTFNGIQIRYNANDGFLYAAGYAANTVIAINPTTLATRVITGFDLPCDFVFTPSAKFAVQQGAVGLKSFT